MLKAELFSLQSKDAANYGYALFVLCVSSYPDVILVYLCLCFLLNLGNTGMGIAVEVENAQQWTAI